MGHPGAWKDAGTMSELKICDSCKLLYEMRLRAEEAEYRDEIKTRAMKLLRTALRNAIAARDYLAWVVATNEAQSENP